MDEQCSNTATAETYEKCDAVGLALMGANYEGMTMPCNQPLFVLCSRDPSETCAVTKADVDALWKALEGGELDNGTMYTVLHWMVESEPSLLKELFAYLRPRLFPHEGHFIKIQRNKNAND